MSFPFLLTTRCRLISVAGQVLLNFLSILQVVSCTFLRTWLPMQITAVRHSNHCFTTRPFYASSTTVGLPKTFPLLQSRHIHASNAVFPFTGRRHTVIATYLWPNRRMKRPYLPLQLYCSLHKSPRELLNLDIWWQHTLFDANMRRSGLQRAACSKKSSFNLLHEEG